MEKILNEEEIKNEAKVFDINLIEKFEYHYPLKNIIAFQNCKNLKYLNLSGCSLKVIHDFGFLKRLVFLDLSHNQLWDIKGLRN